MPQQDDHDDLAALDFHGTSSAVGDHGGTGLDALDFSSSAEADAEDSDIDALGEYAPLTEEEPDSELEALDSAMAQGSEDDAEDDFHYFTVTNPAGTVSVSSVMGGMTQKVELSPKVTNMQEADLAEEILALADLARQKGLAGERTALMGSDVLAAHLKQYDLPVEETIRDFVEGAMHLPTPEQAEEAQAEVFATRYKDVE